MPASNSLIIVEGPRNIEFLACLLRQDGLQRTQRWNNLPSYWREVIPRNFPVEGDPLAQRRNGKRKGEIPRRISPLLCRLAGALSRRDSTPTKQESE